MELSKMYNISIAASLQCNSSDTTDEKTGYE